jgi:excisionase family DNA binding protein
VLLRWPLWLFKSVTAMKLIEILENRKEALKVSEVAKMLGVSPQQIYKMVAAGTIPHFHVQGSIRFCPADLAEWIKKDIEQSTQMRNLNGNRNGLKFGT